MEIPIEHYYHEIGHSLFSLIFKDSFIYMGMYFDKETLLQVGDDKWDGAVHIQGIVEKKFESPSAYFTKLIIIGFSGMCAENFLSHDYRDIEKYVENWIKNPSKYMNTTHVGGDYELIITPSARRFITNDHYQVFRKSVLEFIFNVLHDERVYRHLFSISQELHSRQNDREEGSEIINLFSESGSNKYIEDQLTRIMEDFHIRFDRYKSHDISMRFRLYYEAKLQGGDHASLI